MDKLYFYSQLLTDFCQIKSELEKYAKFFNKGYIIWETMDKVYFEKFNEGLKQIEPEKVPYRGKAFNQSLEIKWYEKKDNKILFVIILKGNNLNLGITNTPKDYSVYKEKEIKVDLWGEPFKNGWFESRIPHKISYPVDNNKRLKLIIQPYIHDGELFYYGFEGIE